MFRLDSVLRTEGSHLKAVADGSGSGTGTIRRLSWRMVAVTALSCAPSDGADGRLDTGTWEFTREVRGDTTFVHTISGSVWGPLPPLEPDLVIGMVDGPEEYLFGSAAYLSVNPEGRIWIWDAQFQEIRAYHPDGAFDRVVSRGGEGPSEVRAPELLVPLPDGRLRVIDVRAPAVIDLNREGAVVDRYRWPALSFVEGRSSGPTPGWNNMTANAGADGTIYRIIWEQDPSTPGEYAQPTHLEAHRPEAGRVDTVALPSSAAPSVRYDTDNRTYVEHWTAGPDGTVIRADAERYVIDVYHPDGRRTSISRDWDPQPFTAAERARAEERGSPIQSEYRLAFQSIRVGLLSDVLFVSRYPIRGELAERLVRELEETDPLDRDWELGTVFNICDVFRFDGTYLGSLTTWSARGRVEGACSSTAVLFDGRVWTLGTGDEGEPQIHRYAVGPG